MPQLGKRLLHEHKDQGLNVERPHKKLDMMVCTYNLGAGEAETGGGSLAS